MKIKIIKIGKKGKNVYNYQADCLDIPGSPELGFGTTKKEAVANLFSIILYNKLGHYIKDYTVEFIE